MNTSRVLHPAPEQARTLMRVVLDLADDLAFSCAVVVIDGRGALLSAERAPALSASDLKAANRAAANALSTLGRSSRAAAAGLPLLDGAGPVGAIGVAGGPEGFAAEAVTAAARALGFRIPASGAPPG